MKQTARRIGYTTLLPAVLATSLSLSLCGCAWFRPKPLLGTRDGMVPPPYVTPAPAPTAITPAASVEPEFPNVMPDTTVFAPSTTDETTEVVPTEGDKECPPDEIVLPDAPEIKQITHTVAKNENLWVIARKYGITYQELASVNNLDANAVLSEGKVLVIPPGGRPGSASEGRSGTIRDDSALKKPVITGAVSTYTVQRGDCLSKIAARCNMKTVDLRKLNGLEGDTIFIGQKLRVQGKVKATTAKKPTDDKPTGPTRIDVKTTEPKGTGAGTAVEVKGTVGPDIPEVKTDDKTGKPEDGGAAGGEKVEIKVVGPEKPANPLGSLPHDICKDDTLENIAEIYGTTVNAILQANPKIKSDADLVDGKTIMVPYK